MAAIGIPPCRTGRSANFPYTFFGYIPILLCVPAPAGDGNTKKKYGVGNTKRNWELDIGLPDKYMEIPRGPLIFWGFLFGIRI